MRFLCTMLANIIREVAREPPNGSGSLRTATSRRIRYMPHAYDATLKYLVARQPSAWLEFVGLPPAEAELVGEDEIQDLHSGDLSTVSAAADILMRMSGGGLAHIDFQAGPDPRMDD